MKKISKDKNTEENRTKMADEIKDVKLQEEKLLSLMKEEETKANENYLLLGKAYMSAHAADYEEVTAVYAKEILESEEKRKHYYHELMKIKGLILCENCGFEVPKNAWFCCNCGKKLPEPEIIIPMGQSRCGNCGHIQKADLKFCMNCGSLMNAEKEEELSPAKDIEEPQADLQPLRCKNCGSILEEDAIFCSECGMKQG